MLFSVSVTKRLVAFCVILLGSNCGILSTPSVPAFILLAFRFGILASTKVPVVIFPASKLGISVAIKSLPPVTKPFVS